MQITYPIFSKATPLPKSLNKDNVRNEIWYFHKYFQDKKQTVGICSPYCEGKALLHFMGIFDVFTILGADKELL